MNRSAGVNILIFIYSLTTSFDDTSFRSKIKFNTILLQLLNIDTKKKLFQYLSLRILRQNFVFELVNLNNNLKFMAF